MMDNHTDGGLNLAFVVGVAGGGITALVLIIVLLLYITVVIFLKKKKTTYDMSGNNRTIPLCTYGPYWLLHHTIFTIFVCVCNTLSKRCVYLY